ncbi:MAG TPA: hypothetical protein VMV71_02350 [Candidatus Paceibacterota bacterium]|nr:hypothetical protein [Candidatus Paceibacterota bacterium]
MDKKIIYLIVAVVVILAGIWLWMSQPSSGVPAGAPQGSAVTGNDTTASINQDLNNVTVQDPNFNAIDTDLNSL